MNGAPSSPDDSQQLRNGDVESVSTGDADPLAVTGVSRVGFRVGVAGAVLTFASVAAYSWVAAVTAAAGALCLVGGCVRGPGWLLRAGSRTLAVATLLAGVDGAPPLAVGVGAWSALVAWDATTFGGSVVRQLGPAARRSGGGAVGLRHVRTTVLVGGGGLAIGASAFLAGARGPVAVGGLAVVAGTAFVLALALD